MKAVVRIKPTMGQQEDKTCFKMDEKTVLNKTGEKYNFEQVFDEDASN